MFPKQTYILVVDDMVAMRIRVINQLKSMGFVNIEQAGDGQEAFSILEKKKSENTPIDLIISDWNMPVMEGIDFLNKVRSSVAFAQLPFIMVTAEGEKQQVIKALKSGVSDYLIKPVSQEVLEKKLSGMWNRQKAS